MSSKGRVYLAGKMEGLAREKMSRWRQEAKKVLEACGFNVLDPVQLSAGGYVPTDREIVTNNKFHIRNCTVVLAELDHESVSIGTVCEVVYASEKGKPVIFWGCADKIILHPWMYEHMAAHFPRLDHAVDYLVANYGL